MQSARRTEAERTTSKTDDYLGARRFEEEARDALPVAAFKARAEATAKWQRGLFKGSLAAVATAIVIALIMKVAK
jgi:hypothetical protein